MICGPVGVHILSGDDAITRWRSMLGPAKMYQSVVRHPEKLRARFGLTDSRNGFHGSDSPESMLREALFFFPEHKLGSLFKLTSLNISESSH
ncbi:Nucleoside diphosphate kinase 6 [Cichlidogyrus casuarinus]|uniref:Nucleoside diphosphate kinase n=1 Tax=Cichlidogyrus casuarinus TaxID=1844966 RepID=A0ABD2PMY0_9PLAT